MDYSASTKDLTRSDFLLVLNRGERHENDDVPAGMNSTISSTGNSSAHFRLSSGTLCKN